MPLYGRFSTQQLHSRCRKAGWLAATSNAARIGTSFFSGGFVFLESLNATCFALYTLLHREWSDNIRIRLQVGLMGLLAWAIQALEQRIAGFVIPRVPPVRILPLFGPLLVLGN